MSLYRFEAYALCKVPRANTDLDFDLCGLEYFYHWYLCCWSLATGCTLRWLAAKLIRAVSHLLTAPYGQRTGSGGHKQSLAVRRRNVGRKAVDSSAGKTTCRLIKTYIDDDSGERICIYKRQGTGLEELSLSMSAFLHCQKDFECKRTAK